MQFALGDAAFGDLDPGKQVKRIAVFVLSVRESWSQAAGVDVGVEGVAHAELDADIAVAAVAVAAPAHLAPVDLITGHIEGKLVFIRLALRAGKLLNLAVVATDARSGCAHVNDGRGVPPVDDIAVAEIARFGGLDIGASGINRDYVETTGDKGRIESEIFDYRVKLTVGNGDECSARLDGLGTGVDVGMVAVADDSNWQ